MQNRGIITVKPGETPPYPAGAVMEGMSHGDQDQIAKLAWAQSNGSILAFEQLCAEHARGEIDLKAIADGRPEDAVPPAKPAVVVAAETQHPAAGQKPAEQPAVAHQAATAGVTGTVATTGTVGAQPAAAGQGTAHPAAAAAAAKV